MIKKAAKKFNLLNYCIRPNKTNKHMALGNNAAFQALMLSLGLKICPWQRGVEMSTATRVAVS